MYINNKWLVNLILNYFHDMLNSPVDEILVSYFNIVNFRRMPLAMKRKLFQAMCSSVKGQEKVKYEIKNEMGWFNERKRKNEVAKTKQTVSPLHLHIFLDSLPPPSIQPQTYWLAQEKEKERTIVLFLAFEFQNLGLKRTKITMRKQSIRNLVKLND